MISKIFRLSGNFDSFTELLKIVHKGGEHISQFATSIFAGILLKVVGFLISNLIISVTKSYSFTVVKENFALTLTFSLFLTILRWFLNLSMILLI